VKDWRCTNHQFGGNRHFRKGQLEPSPGFICYLDLNQVFFSIPELDPGVQAERPVT
jgi:hypothetical protein